MIKTARDLGELIRERRRALGWTQAELAVRCGTGERFIVELEGGKPSCHLEKSLIAARAVGIELGDIGSTHPRAQQSDDELGFLPKFS
ncbi:MAG: helix-turn-helix transcriptional regulator [Rhizobiaceae bacterium]|nr:helix-turn-helix transcriptional regulator [Rhizobiaceae bacterium]